MPTAATSRRTACFGASSLFASRSAGPWQEEVYDFLGAGTPGNFWRLPFDKRSQMRFQVVVHRYDPPMTETQELDNPQSIYSGAGALRRSCRA